MSTSIAINLGTGTGTTVREFIDAFNEVASVPIRAQDAERRPGDVAGANTRIERAVRVLDWQPQYGIADGIRHSLQWAALRHEVLSGRRRTPLSGAGPWVRLDDEDRHDDRTAPTTFLGMFAHPRPASQSGRPFRCGTLTAFSRTDIRSQ